MNYDTARDTYDTMWTDIDAACEACHGPGSLHVAWTNGERSVDDGLIVHFDARASA